MSIQRYDHDTSSDCYGMRRTEDGDFVKYEDHRAAMAQLPLPNPSADEEVETPRTNEELVDAKHCDECGYEVVLADAMRKLERELTQLRQQHNAEREAEYHRGRSHELTEGDWVNRVETLQSELATAQAEKHGLEDVVLATRNMSIEAFDRIRALIGASPNDPRPCETLVSELIESLRSQLQTAMEERDQWGKELGEAKGAIDTLERLLKGAEEERDAAIRECVARGIETEEANGRLEEAEKVSRRHAEELIAKLNKAKGLIDRPEFHKLIDECLSRLSTFRSTGRKDNTL